MDKQHDLPIANNKPILAKDEQDGIDWCERLSRQFSAKKSKFIPAKRGCCNENRRR